MQEGIAAWKAWAEKHDAAIVGMGGPLGKTKKVSEHGIEDITNLMSAYTIVRRIRMVLPPSSSRTIRTSRSSQEILWR